MNSRKNILLSDLIDKILKEMVLTNYSCGSIKVFRRIYNRLEKLAISTERKFFDEEIADMFLADASYARNPWQKCSINYLASVGSSG